MSGDAQQALQKALFQALSGDGVLTGLIGAGRIFDRQVTRAPLPYIVFGEIVSQDWSTASETGSEHRVTIDVWSGAEGRAQAQAIAAAIHDILHDADLPLADGFVLVSLRHGETRTARETGRRRHRARLVFRAAIDAP